MANMPYLSAWNKKTNVTNKHMHILEHIFMNQIDLS